MKYIIAISVAVFAIGRSVADAAILGHHRVDNAKPNTLWSAVCEAAAMTVKLVNATCACGGSPQCSLGAERRFCYTL